MNLTVDPERAAQFHGESGIFVRAKDGDKWVNADIAELDKSSLLAWLRSRGGDNPCAENTVGLLFGHGPLHSSE
jgi:hypothetical protein